MRSPDKSRIGGRAWHLPAATDEDIARNPDYAASIDGWLLNVPGAHPIWHYWVLWAVSLHDLPNQSRPPARHYIGAEFEIGIYSIDPERCPWPDPDEYRKGCPPLHPVDLVYQSHGLTDDQIKTIVGLMVDQMVTGQMSPDSDYSEAWKSSLASTITHFRDGFHDGEPK